MNINWQPVVHSATHVEIPVITVKHSAKAHQRWKDAQEPWRQSGYTDPSAFSQHATLANTGRFRFPKGKQAPYKFGEFHAALKRTTQFVRRAAVPVARLTSSIAEAC